MALCRYLTHPQVQIDPSVAVQDWSLSPVGRARRDRLIAAGLCAGSVAVFSSAEVKAVETATPIAAALGLTVRIDPAMHENDRSATGFLPPPAFEAMADRFFAEPDVSVRGWESARAAQARIVDRVQAALAMAPPGDILFVGHGAVGTLLMCHFAGLAIDRRHDQLQGGGCIMAFSRDTGALVQGWRPLEECVDQPE